MTVVGNASKAFGAIEAIRKEKRAVAIAELERLWDMGIGGPEKEEQIKELLQETENLGLETSAFFTLEEMKDDAVSALGPAMAVCQTSLNDLWEKLCLPKKDRKSLEWQEGEPLTQELFYECSTTEKRLQAYLVELGPLINAQKDLPDLLESTLSRDHANPARHRPRQGWSRSCSNCHQAFFGRHGWCWRRGRGRRRRSSGRR